MCYNSFTLYVDWYSWSEHIYFKNTICQYMLHQICKPKNRSVINSSPFPLPPIFLKSILLMLFFFSVPSDWFFKTKLSLSALKPLVVGYPHLWHTDSKTGTVVLIVPPITALMQNQGESLYREKPVNEEERLHAEKYWSLDSFNLQGSKLSDLHLLLNVCPSTKITQAWVWFFLFCGVFIVNGGGGGGGGLLPFPVFCPI